MDRRRFVIGTAATALAAGPAFAQETYPSRAITIINAFPPGGLNDIVTRPLAAALEATLKQPVVVETKSGAAGQVGAQVAASAKPDGYTLLSHNTGISGYAEIDKLFGRPVKTSRAHFIPLARLIANPVLLLVNDQQPYKTLKEFIEGAKAKPDTLVFSSGGLYGASHLPLAYLEQATGPLKLRHLPTRAAARPSSPSWATTPRSQRNRCRPRWRTSKPASCARWRSSARPARSCCPMCRRSRSSATTSNTICGSGYSRQRNPAGDRGGVARRHTQGGGLGSIQDRARQCRPGARLSRRAGLPEVLGHRWQADRRGGHFDRPTGIDEQGHDNRRKVADHCLTHRAGRLPGLRRRTRRIILRDKSAS